MLSVGCKNVLTTGKLTKRLIKCQEDVKIVNDHIAVYVSKEMNEFTRS